MGNVVVVLALVLSLPGIASAADRVRLFNGEDLGGWTSYLWDAEAKRQDTATPASAVWSVEDGVLICKGNPNGYLRTSEEYENYRLTLEWRWAAGSTRGNSGVLVHTTTPNALGEWPKSVEVQLRQFNAGDLWVVGTTLKVPDVEARRFDRRYANLTSGSEKPAGEWNLMEILCDGDAIQVWVNGDLVNHATDVSATKGGIALQSEGALIQFRNIVLSPLGD